jgi:probable phosphoglycerate mutase
MSRLFESPAEEIARLVLVRHGRTQMNQEARIGARDDSELDTIGLQQAHLAAERLTEFPAAHIYASPIRRAQQTAGIIAAKLNLAVETNSDLTEYHFGLISGLTMNEIHEKYADIYADIQDWIYLRSDPNRDRPIIPEEESFYNLEARTDHFINMVVEKHQGETVIAVTHLGVIKACIASLFGSTVHRPMNYIAFNTSVTVIDFLRKRPILMSFNDTRHLDLDLSYGKITPF